MKLYDLEEKLNARLTEEYLVPPSVEFDIWEHENAEIRRYMHEIATERLTIVENLKSGSKRGVIYKVMRLYDAPAQRYPYVTYEIAESLATDLIASDLLTLMLINKNGNPTRTAREHDWIVNPMNYVVSKQPWSYIGNWMIESIEEKLKEEGGDLEIGVESTDSFEEYVNSVVSEYIDEFGEASILVVPNTIEIDSSGVKILQLIDDISPEDPYPFGLMFFPLVTAEEDRKIIDVLDVSK